MRRTVLALLVALAAAPAALAHPGAHLPGYTSTVSALQPNVLGVLVNVVGGDDRLRLSNYSRKRIVVLGYAGEPYLRFDRRGVYENVRSPNAYLDRFRYAPASPPADADPKATPEWVKVADDVTFEWHDHRIHWRGREQPEVVREAPDEIHNIFDWRVPALANGRRFAITGFLGYAPPPGARDDGSNWLTPTLAGLGGAAALAAAVAAGLWARRARRRAH